MSATSNSASIHAPRTCRFRSTVLRWLQARSNSLLGGLLSLLACGVAAQDYPQKPVRIIMAYNAGGPMDAGARVLAAGLTKVLGQAVIVENKPGASGRIGTETALRSEADGYTLLYAIADQLAINPHVFTNMKYDPLTAFEPVGLLGKMPMVVVARANFSENSAAGLLKLAKSQPGKVSYASWGVGSLGHLSGALMEQIGGIEMLHIPFQGGAPAQQQLLSGDVDTLLVQVPYAMQQVKAGRLKILGLSSLTRNPQWPDIPTVAEQGFPGYAAETWSGLLVPKGTPAAVQATLARAMHEVLNMPSAQAQLKEIGFDVSPNGGRTEFASFIRSENERWGKLIRARNITLH